MSDERKGERREQVDHPAHYGGADNPYEVIKVLEGQLSPEGFSGWIRGTAMKYLPRAGKKDEATQDLKKAAWYITYEVSFLARWRIRDEPLRARIVRLPDGTERVELYHKETGVVDRILWEKKLPKTGT